MPSSKDLSGKTFKKNRSIVSRRIADEMLLVPVRGHLADMERIFTLNPVAEHIWEQLDGQRQMGEIRDSILDAFDVAKEEAEADISEFIGDLLTADLIVEVD